MTLFPNLNSKENIKNSSISKPQIYPARVKNIILDSNNAEFKNINGYADIGSISFQPLTTFNDLNSENLYHAKPLWSNIKNYPIIDEIVLIINTISFESNSQINTSSYYYIPLPLNIWNNINHNILPDCNSYNLNPDNHKIVEKITKTLLPEEGDVLIEGRWGNSIRFSHTTPNKKNLNNSWSSMGSELDPIIVISNNHKNIEGTPWNPIQEDINNDGSSIYMTYGQEIPMEFACSNLQSLNITLAKPFDSTLNIPDTTF